MTSKSGFTNRSMAARSERWALSPYVSLIVTNSSTAVVYRVRATSVGPRNTTNSASRSSASITAIWVFPVPRGPMTTDSEPLPMLDSIALAVSDHAGTTPASTTRSRCLAGNPARRIRPINWYFDVFVTVSDDFVSSGSSDIVSLSCGLCGEDPLVSVRDALVH